MFKKSNALQTLHEKELEKSKENSLMYLSIDIVHENPENDTLYVSELHDKEFRALKEDIREIGIKQPLLVKLHPHLPLEYIVISGHRRLQAAKEIGLKKIPCMIDIIKDEKDKIRSEISLLTTNMLTRNRTPLEKAKEIQKMKELILEGKKIDPDTYKGNTLEILAETLGITTSQVKKYNRLNNALKTMEADELKNLEDENLSYEALIKNINHQKKEATSSSLFLNDKNSFKSFESSTNIDNPLDIKENDLLVNEETLNPNLNKVQKILESCLNENLNQIDIKHLKVLKELISQLLERAKRK